MKFTPEPARPRAKHLWVAVYADTRETVAGQFGPVCGEDRETVLVRGRAWAQGRPVKAWKYESVPVTA